jgi:hypothetical protein
VGAEINNISEISLVMENPVEYILENPYPSLEYAGKKEFLEKSYIGSILKVDKINLIIKTKDGVKLTGEGVVKHLKPSANFKYDSTSKSVLFPDKSLGYLNPINGSTKYNFPKDINQGFNVDNNNGIEEFLFMVFREDNPEMKEIIEKAKSGTYRADTFRNSNIVNKTKGVGGLTAVKVSANETTAGFEFKTKKIQGLPTDFKDTFLLDHK